MATVPVLTAWAAAQKILASKLNAIHDAIGFLLDPPRCQVNQATAQSLVNGAALAVITLDGETYDNDSMHSTTVNNSRVTFNTAGTYLIVVYGDLPTATYTACTCQLRINGTTSVQTFDFGSLPGAQFRVPFVRAFAQGDYVEMLINQTSGANRLLGVGNNVTGMTVHRLSA